MIRVDNKKDIANNCLKLKRLLTVKEAAEYLGISPKTLWEWSRTGIIPMVKFDGKRVKYDIRDLDSLIEQNKIYEPSSEFQN